MEVTGILVRVIRGRTGRQAADRNPVLQSAAYSSSQSCLYSQLRPGIPLQ